MKDKQRKYAVKLYQRMIKENPNYTEQEFVNEVKDHIDATIKLPKDAYEPFSLYKQLDDLWKCLSMNIIDIVNYSKLKMSKFATRYCIPYRTLQAWCDGTNPCPVYTKLLLCENLGLITIEKTIEVKRK